MKTKYTKGEWDNMSENTPPIKQETRIFKTTILTGAPLPTNIIAQVFGKTEEICKANAVLISKAPELLGAVINLQKRLEMLINATPSGIERNVMTEENIIVISLINEICK